MVKLETTIQFVSKKEIRKQEVLSICLGDIYGDGKKEIFFGGGISEVNDNLLYAIATVSPSGSYLIEERISGGFFHYGICYDIDDDGKDELICGNKLGKVFYLDFNDNHIQKNDLLTLELGVTTRSNIIMDIKCIKFENIRYLFSCSMESSVNFIGFQSGEIIFKKEKKFACPIFSVYPFVIENSLHLILGGEGSLFVCNIDKENNLFIIQEHLLEDFKKFENGSLFDAKDRIYRIIPIEEEPGFTKFVCGFRSGKIKILQYSGNLIELSQNESDRSIYDITVDDIDSCGKKEVIVAGKVHINEKDIGFLKIFKIHKDSLTPLCETTYKQKLVSVQSFIDPLSHEKYLLASGIGEPFICFKIVDSEVISGLISSLGQQISENPGKYCFFVGAGFSLPCFPLADELSNTLIETSGVSRDVIFKCLKDHEKAKKILENCRTSDDRIPLEAVLFWYKEYRDRELMIKVLEKNVNCSSITMPNHITLLSKLLKKSLIYYIFSVNYDVLLESTAPEIKVLENDDDFISTNICHKKGIFKLHGSITNPKSIEGSLDELDEFKGNKKMTLNFLFSGHTIIFVGYSCKDPDIFLALEEIVKKNGTSCYFIDPFELSEQAKKILEVSGKEDIIPRHFQISADSFFEYLISKMDLGKDNVVNHNEKEVN